MKKDLLIFFILANLIFALEENNIEVNSKENDKEIILNISSENDNLGENIVRSHEAIHGEEKE